MVVYSCNYPIWIPVTFNENEPIEYTVSLTDGQDATDTIYTGRLYPRFSGETTRFDIAPIVSEYLDVYYEDIISIDNIEESNIESIGKFPDPTTINSILDPIGQYPAVADEIGASAFVRGTYFLASKASSGNPSIYYSQDLTEWNSVMLDQNTEINDIFGSDQVYEFATNNGPFYSVDLLDIFEGEIETPSATHHGVYANGVYMLDIALGSGLIRSTDGVYWDPVNNTPSVAGTVTSLKYLKDIFVITTSDGQLFTSTDGLTFQQSDSGLDTISDVAYGNGYYVVVGNNGGLSISPDAESWTVVDGQVEGGIQIVRSNGLYLLAINTAGEIYVSQNPYTWIKDEKVVDDLQDVLVNDAGQFVFVTDSQFMVYSPSFVEFEGENIWSIHAVEVNITGAAASQQLSFNVMYNYNTDYLQPYPDALNLNTPITYEVDPRQVLFTSGYNIAGSDDYSYSVNNGEQHDFGIESKLFNIFYLDLSVMDLNAGDKISVSNNGVNHNYTVSRSCPNRYVLYYVNKLGGLDMLLCAGRYTESFNPTTRTDVQLYNDRLNRTDWEQKRIYQEIDKQYRLNTGFLSDEQAVEIDNLIYSPKVWIHDLDRDTITSCLITDTSYTVKRQRYDRITQYTINVKESQKQIRR